MIDAGIAFNNKPCRRFSLARGVSKACIHAFGNCKTCLKLFKYGQCQTSAYVNSIIEFLKSDSNVTFGASLHELAYCLTQGLQGQTHRASHDTHDFGSQCLFEPKQPSLI
jgi:hypothetical protein